MHNAEIEARLKTLFATVLNLPPEQVVDNLSPPTCPAWDSLHQIHLVQGIEEEFGFEMAFEDQMGMASYQLARGIVHTAMSLK